MAAKERSRASVPVTSGHAPSATTAVDTRPSPITHAGMAALMHRSIAHLEACPGGIDPEVVAETLTGLMWYAAAALRTTLALAATPANGQRVELRVAGQRVQVGQGRAQVLGILAPTGHLRGSIRVTGQIGLHCQAGGLVQLLVKVGVQQFAAGLKRVHLSLRMAGRGRVSPLRSRSAWR